MGIKARGAERERDRMAAELASIEPDSPRAAEIAVALARGFFAPRPEAVAVDIERAVEILIGGPELPALSDGPAASSWGRHQRPRHIEVPGGVSHPSASELRAHILDRPPAQIDALVAGEVYLGDGGRLHLWPWYPEEEELREAASARAAELGVSMPERFLDEPFESAWYLKHTGDGAVARLFENAGVDPPRLEVNAIPVFDFGEVVEWEGGGQAPPAAAQLAVELAELAANLEHIDDPDYLELARAALRGLLPHYIAAVNGDPEPPLGLATLELAGEPESYEDGGGGDDDGEESVAVAGAAVVIRGVFAVDDGAVVVCDGAVVVVGEGGEVKAAWPCREKPWFCGAGIALFELDGWRAIDLRTGEWLAGELDTAATFGGPLMRLIPGTVWPEAVGETISPDGRYTFEPGGGIRRIVDNRWVASEEVFGEIDEEGWDDDDEQDERPVVDAPEILDPATLEIPGVAVTVIDGVTFTRRRRQSYQVVSEDDDTVAFALAGDRWRALIAKTLRRNDEVLARVPVRCFAASFAPGGSRLWLLLADHIVRVDWADGPRVAATIALAPIAAAAREVIA